MTRERGISSLSEDSVKETETLQELSAEWSEYREFVLLSHGRVWRRKGLRSLWLVLMWTAFDQKI